MEFYSPQEALSVSQLAQRVRESVDGEFNDWLPYQILDPSQMRVSLNWERMMGFGKSIPGQGAVTRLDPIQKYVKFREEIIRDYPAFVVIGGYGGQLDPKIETPTEWMVRLASSAVAHGLKPIMGYGHQNYMKGALRHTRRMGLMKVVEPASGIYAELSDSCQLDTDDPDSETRIMKILFIHNSSRPAPFKVRRFIKALRRMLIDDLKYSWAYGHCATCDQPDHENNAPGCDQRFKRHSTWKITMDDGTVAKFRESNLCWYWQLMGMMAAPSPETDDELTVGLMSEGYRKTLLAISPDVWKQVFRKGP